MFENLLNFLFKATTVEPRYDPKLCLAVKQSTSACSICRDICPHQAITIRRQVEIDEVDCSGCGLCVEACPSQALEARLSYQRGASAKCSQVGGSVQTIHCLGRLAPSDMLRLVGRKDGATLARGDCSDCPVGTAAVAEAVERNRAEALELARLRGREIDIEIVETEILDRPDEADTLSRRELLHGGWRTVQRRASDALAPFDPGGDEDASLPTEMQRRYRIIETAAPEPETLVPWPLPRVADGCIMCPVCTNVCPTKAFRRDFSPAGKEGAVLELEPDRCVGCNACVKACPVHVITLDEEVPWAELSGGTLEAYHRDPNRGSEGSVSR